MRLTAIIIIAGCMHVSAKTYSQNISFSGKNVPLQAVFASIEKQTGLSFFFNYALIKDIKPVTLEVNDAPIEEVLKEVLKGQGLDFYRTGKTIFIVKKHVDASPVPPVNVESAIARQIDVKGRVINAQGEPLPGASIYVKNGKKGTMTDSKGYFQLKGVSENAKLQVSFAGYQSQEVVINDETLNVVLALSNNLLDETQVIAYGQTTQRFSIGDVTTIKGEDIQKQPVNNPLLALEGRVPGLSIVQAAGLPGSGVTVLIQGQNSIVNGNDPLYVIDGVPYLSQFISQGINPILGGSGPINFGSPLNYINPSDIESISVLKDADATAIYGSRAANGAILITTKKGKAGHTKVDLDLQQGIGQASKMIKLMNTQQYLQMRREALKNDGVTTPSTTDYDINGLWDTTRYTNWQKVLIGNSAQYTNLNGNVSGGSDNMQYLIGGTYHRETTVFPGEFSDRKGVVHASINATSENRKFRIQLTTNYQFDYNKLPTTDLTNTALSLAPDAPKIYNPDGSLNWMPDASGASSWVNPLSTNYNEYTNNAKNLIANTVLSYEFIPGLDLKSSFGYNNLQSNEVAISPLISNAPEQRPFDSRYSLFANSSTSSWIIEPQVEFKREIWKGRMNLLIGSTIQQNNSDYQSLFASGYSSDLLLRSLSFATAIQSSSTIASIYKYNAIFGRLNYVLEDKYLLDFMMRRDGSSRFGPANEFSNFWGGGIGWIFSQESWIKQQIKCLSFGKIRASYGTTGNDQIGDYKFLSLYNALTGGIPYQGAGGLVNAGLSNPYLQWEKTKKLQVGLDLGFAKDRILLNAVYYQNRSSNQLLNYALPINTGFSFITKNFPATVQNSGLELTLNTINILGNKFRWSSSLNFSLQRNKLISFPGIENSTYKYAVAIGKPVRGLVATYKYAGVDAATGVYQFVDKSGHITTNPGYFDRIDSINTNPSFSLGLVNKISYGTIEMDFLFQFVKQRGPNNFFGNTLPGIFNANQPVNILDRWQKPNDISTHQKYNQDFSLYNQANAASVSNAGYSNISFLRLTNISISWQFLKAMHIKSNLKNSRIYIQAQNLLTITPYKGLNPENGSFLSVPLLRTITAGITTSL